MSVFALRILIALVLGAIIWFGLRRIWRDWTQQFRAQDRAVHERDLHERSRPDVIDLKRDADGTFRPGDGGGGSRKAQRENEKTGQRRD